MKLSKGTEFMLMALLENIHNETGLNVTSITMWDHEKQGDMAKLKALEFDHLGEGIYQQSFKAQDVRVELFSCNKQQVNVGHFCTHPECHTIVQEEETLCDSCSDKWFEQQNREYLNAVL